MGAVMRFAKATARSIYTEAAKAQDDDLAKKIAKWGNSSHYKTRLDAMIALAKSEPGIPSMPGEYDQAPTILNVNNGLLDLRSGQLNEHRSDALVTKIAGANYLPDSTCQTWLDFLDRIMAGNQNLISFLQRAVGYTLTADVGEQALFFLYGTGANGKTTFLQTIQSMLGDYGRQSAPQLLMAGDRHPTEIADLQGARFVATVEVEEGRYLAEVLVKQLTGGDRMKARFMRRDFFEFEPTYKIWLAANHKPVIRGTDYAIWRRIHLVPFSVTIPEQEQDPQLINKLKSEIDGVLSWAVQGCLEWQKTGLQVPAEVRAATDAYQSEMDDLGNFIEDCCLINGLASVTAGNLYEAYKNWAEKNGMRPMSQRKFSPRMAERGHATTGKRDGAGRAVIFGIGLLKGDSND